MPLKELVDVARIVSGLFMPVIAAIGALIALQQYLITKNKLKLDLYEKRFHVYKVYIDFCLKIADGDDVRSPDYRALSESLYYSKFLFKRDMSEYLESLVSKAKDYRLAKLQNEDQASIEEIERYFASKIIEIPGKFRPYLTLTNR